MKKYFPIFAFIFALSSYLISQVYWNYEDTIASQRGQGKAKYDHYESVFFQSVFKDINNKEYELKKVKAPIVILNFWASWCIPCLEEFPSLVELSKKYGEEKILIFGVNSDEKENIKKIKKVSKKYKINFPIIPDKKGKHLKDYLVQSIPLSIIFHRGKVIEVSSGARDFSSQENLIFFESLLKK